jgi:7-cyano-7-deazaguanine synthase
MKALILLSGGLDSTTALALADAQGRTCSALSIFYGQKHEREVHSSMMVAQHYDIPWTQKAVEIPKGDSVLMHHDADMPHKSYSEIQGVSPTYVPFRNGLLLSMATGIALDRQYEEVWFAAHADDADSWAYPDCTPEFVGAMANAIFIGTYFKVRLVTPFTNSTKAQIVGVGLDLNAPYHLTTSCYDGDDIACGVCPTCISRLEAFAANDATDPISYAVTA